ncbi:Uu.00g081910.m01.CDS01 [Anthostomella pinea]|uniref:Uu.00g081910.m01.CDS01 n=1 Tax=Anthostomella pinea TaxID=933095 RepID=A0AAI8YJG2_9PEZI|nr:Uu.00g081910.m01.CDS01 [Anthostomella pinea]
MPPNSVCEWMLGRNYIKQQKPKGLRSLVTFEALTDDEDGSDHFRIAIPRGKRATSKNVRFEGEATKSAMKKPAKSEESEVSTEFDNQSSGDEGTTEEEPDPDCPCTKCVWKRKWLKQVEQETEKKKKKIVATESTDEETEEEIDTVHAKHKAKKAKKEEAAKSKGANGKENAKPNGKQKGKQDEKGKGKKQKKQAAPETESDTTEATETEPETEPETESETAVESEEQSEEEPPKKKGKQKGNDKGKKDKGQQNSDKKAGKKEKGQQNSDKKAGKKNKKQKSDTEEETEASDTEVETTEAETTEEEEKKDKKKKKEKEKQNKKSKKQNSDKKKDKPAPKAESPSKKSEKAEKQLSFPPHHPPPEIRKTSFLLPPRSNVLHVEHAVESHEDPRPNAFYDNENGVMRVYHGPAYGNPYGALYPKRVYSHQDLPVGSPHPQHNPWYNGFQTVAGQPVPPHVPPYKPGDPSYPWMTAAGGAPHTPPNIPLPPDFTKDFDQKHYERLANRYSLSPEKRASPLKDSNVIPIPTIEIESPAKEASDRKSTKAGSASGSTWGAQGAPGSGSKKGSKKTGRSSAVDDSNDLLRNLNQQMAADTAELQEILSRTNSKNGSAKDPSPQPEGSSGWGGNNNVDGGGDNTWGGAPTTSGADNTWGDAPNTTGDTDVWGNAIDGTNNNDNGDGVQWVGNANDNTFSNNGGWGSVESPHPSNQGSNHSNRGSNNGGNNNSPRGAGISTPVPGAFPSPSPQGSKNSWDAPSHASGGNVVAGGSGSAGRAPSVVGSQGNNSNNGGGAGDNDNTWGGAPANTGWEDATAAQSTGGFWGTEEGQKDFAEGAAEKKAAAAFDGQEWWWGSPSLLVYYVVSVCFFVCGWAYLRFAY